MHLLTELGLTLILTQGISRGSLLLHVGGMEGVYSKTIVLLACRHARQKDTGSAQVHGGHSAGFAVRV